MRSLPSTIKKNHIGIILVLLVIIVAVSATAYYVRNRAYKESINEAGKTIFNAGGEAAYVDLDGNQATLDSYEGSILIVNNWASWSPFAVTELPLLEKIASEFADKNVIVLAVNRKETKEQAQRFLNEQPPVPHVKVIIDTKDYFYGVTGGYAMPETLIYDADGVLKNHIRGLLEYDTLKSEISTLIEK